MRETPQAQQPKEKNSKQRSHSHVCDTLNIFTEPAAVEQYRPQKRCNIEYSPNKVEPSSSLLTWLKPDPDLKYRSRSEAPARVPPAKTPKNDDKVKIGKLEKRLFNNELLMDLKVRQCDIQKRIFELSERNPFNENNMQG
jgi:hypothetical protein